MTKAKELHLYIDDESVRRFNTERRFDHKLYICFDDTMKACLNPDINIIHTTQIHFLHWRYAEKLFAHIKGETHEIGTGLFDTGTERYLTEHHNLEKLLISGDFEWYTD